MDTTIITLRTSDNVLVKTNLETARVCNTILSMLEEADKDCKETIVDVPEVNSVTLEKVLQWASFHKEDEETMSTVTAEQKEWDENFLDVDPGTLFEILLAAEYLDIQKLLDISCNKVVGMIKGHSLEKIRENFGIKNDLSKEEEDQIRKENEWCNSG